MGAEGARGVRMGAARRQQLGRAQGQSLLCMRHMVQGGCLRKGTWVSNGEARRQGRVP